jgi:hypothetical protein
VSAGKPYNFTLPNLTKQSLVPNKVTITELDDNNDETPVSGIMCKISSGGTEVGNYNEPHFRLTNELDLSPYQGIVNRTGMATVNISNRSNSMKKLVLCSDYKESYGGVLYEDKIDHFENLLNDIHTKGYCTRIVVSFNKQVKKMQLAPVCDCDEEGGSWIEALTVPLEPELDIDDQIYTIDLTNKDLGPQYSENLNFLSAQVEVERNEDDKSPFYMYVTAYGFPYSR